MDSIQEQVVILTGKVDALHQMIDQVNVRVSEILATVPAQSVDDSDLYVNRSLYGGHSRLNHSILDSAFEHKDVLLDNSYGDLERQGQHDAQLSSEVQIQRLTAQLTAAYNRIAALEEQLLATRSQ